MPSPYRVFLVKDMSPEACVYPEGTRLVCPTDGVESQENVQQQKSESSICEEAS